MNIQHLERMKILIVDDQDWNIRLLEMILQNDGYCNIRSLTDPLEVAGVYRDYQPDLLLLDWMMPRLDGLGVLERLRTLIPDDDYLPTLVLTADVTSEARKLALASGASDFLSKPFENYEVSLRIRNLLQTRYLHRSLRDKNRSLEGLVADRTRQLVEQEKQFQRVQRLESIGVLASGIAHDLNNVMTPIVMGLELFRNHLKTPALQQLLASMQSSAQRGGEMVKQILTFARGTADQRTELLLSPSLTEITKLLMQTFPKNIAVRLEGDHNLWLISADVTQMHQVLMNLAVNARDAMPKGGTLRLSAHNHLLDVREASLIPGGRPGPHVVIEVSDTGVGIAPEHLPKIFDPFFSTKELTKGTGLGLPTLLNIVQAHDGFVAVKSEVGIGTTFRVYLPALLRGPALEAAKSVAPLPTGQGQKILVVDDDAAVRELTRSTLETAGYRVETAADGQTAVRLLLETRGEIEAVILDLMMPDMDGFEVIETIKRESIDTGILAVSGSQALILELQNWPGVDNFLAKPYRAETLLRALGEVLSLSGSPTATA